MTDNAGGTQIQLAGDLREGQHKANTPLEWVSPVSEAVGGFELDPCASRSSDLAETNIRETGGLTLDWGRYRSVWVNHPFGDPGPWIDKAAECDAETIVTLSKCDPSADWFQRHAKRADVLAFPAQRIQFIGYDNDSGFPVVYGVYGKVPGALLGWFDRIGWVVTDP